MHNAICTDIRMSLLTCSVADERRGRLKATAKRHEPRFLGEVTSQKKAILPLGELPELRNLTQENEAVRVRYVVNSTYRNLFCHQSFHC